MPGHRAAPLSRRLLALGALVAASLVLPTPSGAGAAPHRPVRSAPPLGSVAALSVNGTYQPFVGDFDADGRTDIFWYAPGAGSDSLWLRGPSADRIVSGRTVDGTFRPIVGNFGGPAGHKGDDILWYAPGPAPDSLWIPSGSPLAFTAKPLAISGTYRPLVGNFAGDAHDDVYWYSGVAGGTDVLWRANGNGTFSDAGQYPTTPDAMPLVGRFRGPRSGIFFYRPGAANDFLATFDAIGGRSTEARSVTGAYRPKVGDYYGQVTTPSGCADPDVGPDGVDDIAWYAPGSAPDVGWQFAADLSGAVTLRPLSVSGTYRPISAHLREEFQTIDCSVTTTDDVALTWYDDAAGTLRIGAKVLAVPAHAAVLVGDFDPETVVGDPGSPHDYAITAATDVVFYRPGAASDAVVWNARAS